MATDRNGMHRTFNIALLTALLVLATAVSFQASYYIGDNLYHMPFTSLDASEDIWFDSDTRSVVSNMTDITRHHWTLYKHPMFSGIAFPVTQAVAAIVGDTLLAVHIVYAANAPITVLLLWLLLARLGVASMDRALLCLLFIASSTMLFWYSVPETFPFGANTLLIALHAAISGRPQSRLGYLGHALASLATFSMTITNWVAGMIATATAFSMLDRPLRTLSELMRGRPEQWVRLKSVFLITASVLAVAVPIALLQNEIFGEASVFFYPPHLLNETEFMFDYRFSNPFMRPFVMLLSPIVVGTVETWHDGTRLMADNFIPGTWYGLIALGLWIALLLGGLWTALNQFRDPSRDDAPARRLAIAASLSLLFMIVLHLVFGYLIFLYVPHTLPYVLSIVGLLFLTPARNPARILTIALIVFALIHNLETLRASVAFIDTLLPG
ncbi:hypothetical protein [Devosia faecipullorum]|uniref:hypothetical protein n=1 Tax=Devosia faecipullorum TaxID=2755039 RepID=UPI00187B2F4A|nr:hypothetical protein [Devosia faecipullorum]MBE7731950.1 hypothetical protein [Devosia faecipullorum]